MDSVRKSEIKAVQRVAARTRVRRCGGGRTLLGVTAVGVGVVNMITVGQVGPVVRLERSARPPPTRSVLNGEVSCMLRPQNAQRV